MSQDVEGTAVLEDVDAQIKQVRTRALDLSFNELLDMYESSELIIDPDYQRLFRWTSENQSRFIESLVLEMPIPPIYAIERDEGVYELIDGLQRVSTYIHFAKGLSRSGLPSQLILEGCDIAHTLNGLTFKTLPRALHIKLKRAYVRVEILRKESDPRLRYHMFKRLNTGGEQLSEQEVRNCSIRLLSKGDQFIRFLRKMKDYEPFRICTSSLNAERIDRMYDQELVLRFLAFKNYREKFTKVISDFLTDYMESVADPGDGPAFDYVQEEKIFNKTFSILNASLGMGAFAGIKQGKKASQKLVDLFLVYHYEALTLGLQHAIDKLEPTDEAQMNRLEEEFLNLKENPEFRKVVTGGGLNDRGPLKRRIELATEAVDKVTT
jgi:hypothetical protein